MPKFPIVPARTAMLFFDCLEGFLRPEDPAARAAVEQSGAIPKMQEIERACRARGIPIFYTQIDHRPDLKDIAPIIADDPSLGERRGPREPVVVQATEATPGTWKMEILKEIAPQANDYVIRKQRWSAFYETNFFLHLRRNSIDTLMIAGGNTEVGVTSTAYSARDRDINTIILKDACLSQRPGLHELMSERLLPMFTRVMSVAEAIALFAEPA